MALNHVKQNKGFVILFAVTLASIILAIALGVSNIALKELNFSTSAKSTNDAFVAADTGAECALFYDKLSGSSFPTSGSATAITCAGTTTTPVRSVNGSATSYTFTILNMSSPSNGSCAKITVLKETNFSPTKVTITSTGYNTGDGSCNSTNINRVARELKVTSYEGVPPSVPPPISGLVGNWKLDEGSGTTAADSSGNGYTGTLVGSPAWATGQVGSAINFDGNDDYITVGDIPTPTDLSIIAWIYPTATNTSNDYIILNKNNTEYDFRINSPTGELCGQAGGTMLCETGMNLTTPANNNHWYPVAYTFSDSGNTHNLYRDGILVNSGTNNSSMSNSANALWIGRHSQFNFGSFPGIIDEVGLYNRVLTLAEINSLAPPLSPPPGAPTGVTATAGSCGTGAINISWTASSGATSYNVLRSTTSGSGYTQIASGITTTSYPNTGLTGGTTYYYVVQAVNGAGTSSNSSQASAVGPSACPTPPGAPSGVTATAGACGTGTINISWTASSGATSYNVLRSTTSGGTYTTIGTGVTSPYSDTSQGAGTFFYKVRAVNGVGTTDSAEVSATTPSACPLADLNAGAPTPSTATTNVPLTFTSTITNGGSASTGSSFNNLFQVATAAGGGGTISVISVNSRALLTAGASGPVTSSSYTFTSAGTSSVRTCTDNDAGFIGTISESNEANNCSTWTNVTVVAGPVAYWKFDDGSGTTAADSSGTGNPGTLQNGPTWIAGFTNTGLNFTGANEIVNGGSNTSLDDLGPMTFSAMIKPNNMGESNGGLVFGKSNGSGDMRFAFSGGAGANALSFTRDYSTTDLRRDTVNGSIPMGVWSHLVLTWDGTTNATGVRIYVNDVEVSYQNPIDAVGSKVTDGSLNFNIGNLSGLFHAFNGVIDEVKVYNRVLSPAELLSLLP